MKKKIAGILIIVLSIGMLGFWELWGRENLSYRTVAVLKESCEAHTMIREEMLRPLKMESPPKGAILWDKADVIIGMETKQFVAGEQALHREYFCEPLMRLGKEFDRYVLSIPDTWLISSPVSVKRGDKAFFYLGEEMVCEAPVIHVKDSYGNEVTYKDTERYYPSGKRTEIEVIVSSAQMEKMNRLNKKGNRFTLIYTEEN